MCYIFKRVSNLNFHIVSTGSADIWINLKMYKVHLEWNSKTGKLLRAIFNFHSNNCMSCHLDHWKKKLSCSMKSIFWWCVYIEHNLACRRRERNASSSRCQAIGSKKTMLVLVYHLYSFIENSKRSIGTHLSWIRIGSDSFNRY